MAEPQTVEIAILTALEARGSKPSRVINNLRLAGSRIDPVAVRPTLERMVSERKILFVLGLYCRIEDITAIVEDYRVMLTRQAGKFTKAPQGNEMFDGAWRALEAAQQQIPSDGT